MRWYCIVIASPRSACNVSWVKCFVFVLALASGSASELVD